MPAKETVLVTGGAGYVGAVLVPRLLDAGYAVRVLDLYIYGTGPLDAVREHPDLTEVHGDIRDADAVRSAVTGCDAVIHLACISNDPSFELNPNLSKSINFDAFGPLVDISKETGVRRFIYASTSSVYGVSDSPEVTEDHPLIPITDYNKYKGLCEPVLFDRGSSDFVPVVIRPATVCGYSPRQRFDLSVNILTNHAVNNRKITVFGGEQTRPNIHIDDIVDLYIKMLGYESGLIAGEAFNAGYQNSSIRELANTIKHEIEEHESFGEIDIVTTPSDDIRSYNISSDKIKHALGYVPEKTIENAVSDLCDAFHARRYTDPLANRIYYNIKQMQKISLA